jgi:excisionase family DNA binding protein
MQSLQEIPTQKDTREAKSFLRIKKKNPDSKSEFIYRYGGNEIELSPKILEMVDFILENISKGKAVSIVPTDQEITTQVAADMLNVSRPYVVKLLEEGKLPYRKVGRHRRIKLRDVQRYDNEMQQTQQNGLDELAKLSQEMGIDY